jgi:hypothetical protein
MEWMRLTKTADLDKVLKPALKQLQFNTCSGPGHRERKFNRLLTLVGYRAPRAFRTEQQLGIIYPNKPALQEKAIEMIQALYAERTGGQALPIWLPKAKDGPNAS